MDPTWGEEFEAIFPNIEAAIKESAFVAIDCEFTGLKDPKAQTPKPQGRKQTIQERYKDVISHKNAGFALIQLGICPVTWDSEAGHYIAKPFNFFVSPVIDPMFGMDRSFLCQASAIDMLCREGFDLNHLLRHGIRYLSKDEEKEIREKEIEMTNGVRDQILIDEGGETFLSQCRNEIQEWLDDSSKEKYDFVNITVSSSYYKRLLHQSLPTMFPHLMIRASKRHFIQIVKNTRSVQKQLRTARKEKFDARLNEAVGLRKVLDLIIENKSVVVGHNVFQDLVFVYSQFLGRLPETVEEFSNVISKTFPTWPPNPPLSHICYLIVIDNSVYDTKYISAMHPSCQNIPIPEYLSMSPLPPTSLETLAIWTRIPTSDRKSQLCISGETGGLTVALHHQFLRYGFREIQHEAGYDAFMTAKVFLALAAEMAGWGGSGLHLAQNGDLANDVTSDHVLTNGFYNGFRVGESAETYDHPSFRSFEAGIFEDWEGLLCVNGTIEGSIKLESKQGKEPLEFVLFEESGYDSCVETD